MAEVGDDTYDVFLVHSSDDRNAAFQIKTELTRRGLKTYAHFDEGSAFGIGKPTVNSIMEAVSMSKIVLILLTVNAIKSQWVKYEILLSLERSYREGSMCCRLCMVGISEEERRQYQTGEMVHIPSVFVDFNRENWADQLYSSIKEEKHMEEILRSGNVAVGLVFNYFVGFLRQILPSLKSTIEASDYFKNNPGRMSEKFFVLLPSSCEIPQIEGGGEGNKPLVKKEGNLSIQAAHGDKSRHYNPTVYSVEDNGEKYFFVGECPAIVETMSKLQKNRFAEIDIQLQVERFRITLQELVQHRNNKVCNNSVTFICYDDLHKSAQEVVCDKLIEEMQLLSASEEAGGTLHTQIAFGEPGSLEEYFASVTNTDSRIDQGTASAIMEFLDSKDKTCSNGDAGKPMTHVLEMSRWNIFIFSSLALKDPLFKKYFTDAINASINDDQMQVIPVLSRGMKLQEVPSYYKWVTLLSADEPDYLEKLWKVMSSPPVKMTEKIPAGKVYIGLAWAYLLNYLPLALLGTTAENKNFYERFEDAMGKYKLDDPYLAKLFIIIPTSCSFPPPGTQFEGEEHIGPLEPVVLGFRKFFLQLYRITTSKGKKFCYAREYATPVIAMHEMANTYPFAGLTKEALFEQTKLFTQYVKEEIARDNFKIKIGDLESRIRLVHYDDMTERDGKRQTMVEALEHEIDLCLEAERPSLPSLGVEHSQI